MTSRAAQNPWSTAWQTAPPSACATLRNNAGIVEWGYTCVFSEDGGTTINPVNTACLPWAPSSTTSQGFFSPATACPTSWSAVATQTSGTEWVDGETALLCCPHGFDADGGNCRPASTGIFPVVECGEADAEENESRTYSGAAWPAGATVSVVALQMRFQPSDVGSVSSVPTSTESAGTVGSVGDGGGGGLSTGLSTGIKIAIGVVIPLAFLVSALVVFFLWRRRKHQKATRIQSARLNDEKPDLPPRSLNAASPNRHSASNMLPGSAIGLGIAAADATNPSGQHETPEWNHEMDATESERQRLLAVNHAPGQYTAYTPAPTGLNATGNHDIPSELGGIARISRKPIAPVEIDGEPWRAELGSER